MAVSKSRAGRTPTKLMTPKEHAELVLKAEQLDDAVFGAAIPMSKAEYLGRLRELTSEMMSKD